MKIAETNNELGNCQRGPRSFAQTFSLVVMVGGGGGEFFKMRFIYELFYFCCCLRPFNHVNESSGLYTSDEMYIICITLEPPSLTHSSVQN